MKKYKVGDVFVRQYCNVDHLCILTSCDFDSELERGVWKSTMNPIAEKLELFGGGWTVYLDEDLDSLKRVGNVGDLLRYITK